MARQMAGADAAQEEQTRASFSMTAAFQEGMSSTDRCECCPDGHAEEDEHWTSGVGPGGEAIYVCTEESKNETERSTKRLYHALRTVRNMADAGAGGNFISVFKK